MITADVSTIVLGSIFWDAYGRAMHWFYSLDMQGWFVLLSCAVVLGAFCLRGFGSRSSY